SPSRKARMLSADMIPESESCWMNCARETGIARVDGSGKASSIARVCLSTRAPSPQREADLFGQPGPQPAQGPLRDREPLVFANERQRLVRVIRDQVVHAQVDEPLHIPRFVDRPDVHVLVPAVRGVDERAVHAPDLHTQKIDVESLWLAGVDR